MTRIAAKQLAIYRKKRDFAKTPEPDAGGTTRNAGHRYLIQKHAARRLHYDFRLELDGVLKSWAVTKGPSLDPSDRRLAVHVEDHPLAYGKFEGIIPQGQYGGGTVMLWDHGSWKPKGDARKDYARGRLHFTLEALAVKGEMQPAARVILAGIALRLPAAVIPQHHRAAAVLALRDDALELAVGERMIFDMDGEAPIGRIEARPLGDRPAFQYTVELETKIVM